MGKGEGQGGDGEAPPAAEVINTAHPFSGAPPAPAGDPFKLAGPCRCSAGVVAARVRSVVMGSEVVAFIRR